MFEKEAEEIVKRNVCGDCNKCQSHGYIGCDIYRYSKDSCLYGLRTGYNKAKVEVEDSYRESLCNSELNLASVTEQLEELEKANEWHYPSKGELPTDKKDFKSYVVAYYWAKGSFANGKPCWEELCYDTENKRWVDRETLEDLPYVNKEGIVIAWKEIVLPEPSKYWDLCTGENNINKEDE